MKEELKKIRQEIDLVDDQIIPLLEKRFSLAKKIHKNKEELTDTAREETILDKTTSLSVKTVYQTIFSESKKIMKSE